MKTLAIKFYERDSVQVAKDLLGKILLHRMNHEEISGRIVEAEAYVENDIASKTLRRRKVFGQLTSQDCGTTFIYMVHGNWLLNIVAHPRGSMGGVLIRAIEPIRGIETMKKDRNIGNQRNLTNGPGKLTEALAITKELNRTDVTRRHAELAIIEDDASTFEIGSSHRIGVTRDLPQELRFFIKANKYVSKR
jgi:DNA-3-methyladenine glycosylase